MGLQETWEANIDTNMETTGVKMEANIETNIETNMDAAKAGAEDMFAFARIAAAELDNQPDIALALVGRGGGRFNPAYAALDYIFKDLGHTNIFVGTAEGYPTLDNVLRLLAKTPYLRVRLAPLALAPGEQADASVAAAMDLWQSRLQDAGYLVERVSESR